MIAALLMMLMQAAPADLVGMYDGGQHEMAAGLELQADGRFRYALSYGALDEEAAGRWTVEDGGVVLTGDPVTPPRIALVSRASGTPGRLTIALDVPRGTNRQYFDVRLTGAEGADDQQMGEDGADIALTRKQPVRVSIALPMFDLESEQVEIDPRTGAHLSFAFARNDLGKVAFVRTPLARDGDALVLERHGRTLRFRRVR